MQLLSFNEAGFKEVTVFDTESEVNNSRFRFLEMTGVMATSSVVSTYPPGDFLE